MWMTFRKTIVASLLYCLLFLTSGFLAMACSPQESANAPPTIKVAVVPWPGYSAHWVGVSEGLFEAESINVQEVTFSAQTDADSAFLAGKADIVWTGLPNALAMISRDPSIQVMFQCDYSDGADGILGRNVGSTDELKGKTVARENILIEELLLRKYLDEMAVSRSEIEVIDLAAADAATAFVGGKVDVAVTFEPWMTKAATEGNGEVIFSSKNSNVIPDGLLVRKDFLENNSDTLQAFLRGVDKSVALIESSPGQVVGAIAQGLGITPEEVLGQLAGVKLYTVQMNKDITFNLNDPMNLTESLKAASDTAVEMELIPAAVDIPTAINDSVVATM